MPEQRKQVCSVEHANLLDHRLRRWFQNPDKLLAPYVRAGMTVLDIGCGPGFFTRAAARLVGLSGHVVAADLQEGMLDKLRRSLAGTEIESRVLTHQCAPGRIGWTTPVDFALAFYVVHEVPDARALFEELSALLKPGGRVLVAEPAFHVSAAAFAETLRTAHLAGFASADGPRIAFSRTVSLMHPRAEPPFLF